MTQAKKAPAKSLSQLLAGAKAVERTARVCLRGDLLGQIESLSEELVQAKLGDERENRLPQAPAIAKQIVKLTDEARAAEVEFVFRAIGRLAWADLKSKHLPTEAQKKKGYDVNPETLAVPAMAASCVSPVATLEDFQAMADDPNISGSQWDKLFLACFSANEGSADIPFSAAAFAIARPSETSSGSQSE